MSTRRSHIPVALVVDAGRREISDEELARALRSGSAWAITETWRRFAPAVIVMASRALGSESEAEDVAQETFHRVYRKAGSLRDPARLRSYIFSFAIRVLRSELRRRKTNSWLSFHQPESMVDLGGETLDIESRDLLRRFYELLDRLLPRHRLVFALRHMEHMTVEEVAAHMELSVSTVKRSLDHAERKMSRWIETDLGWVGFLDSRGWKR
jgi:RNA polymerase sigma-70 factor (ECF subfamily)